MGPKNATPGTLTDTLGRRNRKIPDRNCNECGVSYRPKRLGSKYCGVPCKNKNTKGGWNKVEGPIWWTNQNGYIEGKIWVNGRRATVRQHRYFLEAHIGRKLRRDEDVHHLNGDKSDNRIENLKIVSHAEHTRITNAERPYKKGYTLNLSDSERERRSRHMASVHERRRLAKARGEQ